MAFQMLFIIGVSVYLFILCINASLWYFGNQLEAAAILDAQNNPLLRKTYDFEAGTTSYNDTIQGFETNPYNPAFIFGDFGRSVTETFNLMSGGFVLQSLNIFGFPDDFNVPIQFVVVIFPILSGLIYLISGRQ